MISIHVDTPRLRGRPPEALLHDRVQSYLTQLDGFDTLRSLAGCDPYDDKRFPPETAQALHDDLLRFAERVAQRTLPNPPPAVGYSPGDTPDEAYGWPGLEAFCRELQAVCSQAIERGVGVVACGD